MSGHVFHPGHETLHGITVVLETTGPVTIVGRYDKKDERGIHLLNVSLHDATSDAESRQEFLDRSNRFGIRVDRPHLVVPEQEVKQIVRLAEAVS